MKTRLGCRPGGVEELKKHPFFRPLNWKTVYKKKVKPALMPERFEFRSAPGPVLGADAPQAPVEYAPEGRLKALKETVHFQNFSFSYRQETALEADKVADNLGPVLRHSSEIRYRPDGIEVASPQEVLSSTFSDDSVMLRKKRRKRSSSRVTSLRLPNVARFRYLEDPRKPKTGDHKRKSRSMNLAPAAPPSAAAGGAAPPPDLDDQKLSLLKSEASKDNRNRKFIAVGDSSTQAESLSLDLTEVKTEAPVKKRSFAPLSARGNKGLVPRRHRRSRSTGTEDLAKIAKAEHAMPARSETTAAKASDPKASDPKPATCSRCDAPFKHLAHKVCTFLSACLTPSLAVSGGRIAAD